MSPRRNARALARPPRRHAAGGKTRALGQHFLRDDAVAERMVALLAPSPRDLVLEIGPGRGAITGRLARAAGRLLALEVDRALAADLAARFAGDPRVEVRVADARFFDYRAVPLSKPDPGGRVLVAGNLPYSVGKPILMALVEAGSAIDEMALMLQKEVAERVAAGPGGRTYGSLSVLTQMVCTPRLCFTVPPAAFAPPPQVDSAVLHLRAHDEALLGATAVPALRTVVLAAFGQRRKSLANALSAGLGMSVERARTVCAEAGVDPGRRAETLSLAEFVRLSLAAAQHGSLP
jgi:16S rRNA (adenine1518-N6/adenine1519-N6)-dimethyltransferase